MVNPVGLVPLVVAIAIAAIPSLSTFDRTVNTRLTQYSRRYFSQYVPEEAPQRRQRLRAAYIDDTYRSYAAKTYLVTALMAVSGAVIGVYVTGGALLVLPLVGDFINQLPDTIAAALGRPELDPVLSDNQILAIVTVGGVISGILVAGLTYWSRWERPRSEAEVRRRSINEGLPRTTAFIYALSRGGMEVPKMMRILARNRDVFGEGAAELSVAVRQMDLFGSDIITAVRHVSERTPSEQFKTFSENLASVLQSGQSLSEFLRNQYERYQDEAEERQQEILQLLSTIAETYVTTLVAGVLFLMTILLIFGLTTTQTINFLRMLAYVLIPLANIGFMVYLAQKLELIGVSRGTSIGPLREAINGFHSMPEATTRASTAPTESGQMADGGAVRRSTEYRAQLEAYDSVKAIRSVFSEPAKTLLRHPKRILWVTVPVTLLFVAIRMPAAFNASGFNVRTFDDILIQAFLFVVGTFAIVWELYSRRISKMETELPELVERLASLNDAGMSVVESFDRVRDSDLGALGDEVDRIWRDIEYGSNVDDALRRFGLRVQTTATTRIVTLLTNALKASGNLGPILYIAAEQAESELRMRRQRRQQMLTYLVVIYISFLVFLVIILAVQEVLVPSLPNNVPAPSQEQTRRLGVGANQFSRFGKVNKAAYTLVFFHTALIQAVMSGFIGGQLGEGSLKDGAKHAAIMLGVAYVAFLLISSPSAQVTFQNQDLDGSTVVVETASLTDGGFVVIRADSPQGKIVGRSGYLSAGTHKNVKIQLDNPPGGQRQLYAVPHLDTNGNKEFDYTEAPDSPDSPYQGGQTGVADPATVRAG